MATTILLARHGETDWNRDRRVQGHSDIPLNDAGRRQARALARLLADEPLDAVYASDLSRARETAEIATVGRGLPVRELVDLRERHFGTWEGLTDTVIRERYPESRTGPWGDGETFEAMAARVTAALLDIAVRHRLGSVLVMTHGGPIRAVLRACDADPAGPIENCDVSRVVIDGASLRHLGWVSG
jgi:probable phosphoglycerate mutase